MPTSASRCGGERAEQRTPQVGVRLLHDTGPVRTTRGRRLLAWLRTADVGVAYAVIVVVLALTLMAFPGLGRRVVASSSTNLVNLRSHPFTALVFSAFVLSTPWSLWLVPLLVWGYGTVQRRFGRLTTVIIGVAGHVGATLIVAVLLVSGITHGAVDRGVARAVDVGVSYGLVAIGGVCLYLMPRSCRWGVAVALVVLLAAALVVDRDFSDLGHSVALVIGVALGWIMRSSARAPWPAVHRVGG